MRTNDQEENGTRRQNGERVKEKFSCAATAVAIRDKFQATISPSENNKYTFSYP